MDAVRDIEVEGLPARLYRPRPEPLPLVLYLHAGGRTAVEALVYANADLTGSHPAMRENAEGGGLDPAAVRWFNSQWVPDEARWGEEGVSPLAAADLAGTPPALIVSARELGDLLRAA
jgi:acetyl esterase/lipase